MGREPGPTPADRRRPMAPGVYIARRAWADAGTVTRPDGSPLPIPTGGWFSWGSESNRGALHLARALVVDRTGAPAELVGPLAAEFSHVVRRWPACRLWAIEPADVDLALRAVNT